ncbi:MAG: hypothetical protein WC222_07255 [Parachlamydiales bacterium]
MRIGVDIEGGDASPETLWKGVVAACEILPHNVELLVFASQSFCSSQSTVPHIQLVPCKDVITMSDEPLYAIRSKKDATMTRALRLHQEGGLEAIVSCGNTGALFAGSYLFLSDPRVSLRPALLANIPTSFGQVTLLDVGGTIECSEEQLFQFAILGAAYCKAVKGTPKPKIGLLNIGREESKGAALHRNVYERLSLASSEDYDFIGNIEGRDLFHSDIDAVVCDGFSGNVLLKTAEGLGLFLIDHISQNLQDQISPGKLNELQRLFDYIEHPGGYICGIRGNVVKCHGAATSTALANSILYAAKLAQSHAAEKIITLLYPS